MHSDFSYDALRAHKRGRGDNSKFDIFLLVTTRLIAHSGPSECFRSDTGGNFGRHQNASFCYQKVATRSRSASVHSDFSYDALRAHRRGRGDNSKN